MYGNFQKVKQHKEDCLKKSMDLLSAGQINPMIFLQRNSIYLGGIEILTFDIASAPQFLLNSSFT